MTTTQEKMADVIAQVRLIGDELRSAGWQQANAVGELCTPDMRLWFSTVYVTGEYTVHAFHRAKGAGPARGNIRVRFTPTLIANHPTLGQALADDLKRAALEVAQHGFDSLLWPPPVWSEMSHEGVVDYR